MAPSLKWSYVHVHIHCSVAKVLTVTELSLCLRIVSADALFTTRTLPKKITQITQLFGKSVELFGLNEPDNKSFHLLSNTY